MAVQLSAFQPWTAPDDPTKRIVTDARQFERLVRFLRGRPLVFDYETSGLAYYQGREAVGIGLGSWDDQGNFWSAYVPFRHRTGEKQLDIRVIGPAIAELLADPSTLKIAHNIKFEDHFSRREGWVVAGPRYDTMVAARLHNENRFVALEDCAATDLGLGDAAYEGKKLLDACVKQLAKDNKMGKNAYLSKVGYAEIPIDICGYYGCFDITHCGQLCAFYESKGLSARYPRIWPTEMALTEVLCDTEQNGLALNTEYLHWLSQDMHSQMAGFEAQLSEALHGQPFEMGSDQQLRQFMVEKLGLTWEKKTKSDLPSVDADVLESFASQFSILQIVLNWREVAKVASTYTTSLIDQCDANGFLHGNLQQVGTKTGRLSCSSPNYQNMPAGPQVRQAFIVRKGWVRLFLDYSQIELRVLAYYSRDPIMVDVYLHNGDIHERTRVEVEQILQHEVERRVAKIVNFGLSYGLTSKGLSAQAGIAEDEAEKFLHGFFARYAGIDVYRKELWSQARRNGNQVDNLWGRTRRMPDLQAPQAWRRSSAERRLTGSMIQGTAAELTKESMVRISRWLKANQVPALIVNTVHDEIQLDMPREYLPMVMRVCKALMEDYPEFHPIPIIVDAEVTETNWAEKQPAKVFFETRPEFANYQQ